MGGGKDCGGARNPSAGECLLMRCAQAETTAHRDKKIKAGDGKGGGMGREGVAAERRVVL